jgi:2-dehydro-3-deoxygluconokinase
MKKIYFLGECMVELRAIDETTMSQSFAGDLYNSAVYLKRCFPDVCASMVTAIGRDKLSKQMFDRFESEDLETQFVFEHASKAPGMYLIETDDTGERSFTYWRSDSAARTIVDFLNQEVLELMSSGDMFFFSGISLAVIEEGTREAFWRKLEQLKSAGVKIVFDPNYRARLWRDQKQAVDQFNKAFRLSNIALPGVEDLTVLYGVETAQGVIDFCQPFGIGEVVVKNGPESVITNEKGLTVNHEITPVTNVVDTTSAGDAFNGVYLGARLNGRNTVESVKLAASAAGTVIQHRGAIAPMVDFKHAMSIAGL